MNENENVRAVREKTFEEEAELFEKRVKEIFSREGDNGEPSEANCALRDAWRTIRKAYSEIRGLQREIGDLIAEVHILKALRELAVEREKLKNLLSVTTLAPHILYIPKEKREDFIRDTKERMLCDLMEKYPAKAYKDICFEMQASKADLYNAIEENFKREDGRYIFHGDFVSRESIERELENVPLRVKMVACVKQEDLSRDE
ncbi:MAG: hypothetical protein IJW22_08995 [Clostridia bacterium]|nr:hypothetical protein [Clostridia bacterium]